MPRISAKGEMSSQGFGQFSGGNVRQYVEDVFNITLYAGTGATQNIVNNLDLTTGKSLVWIKARSSGIGSYLFDTVRGALLDLNSDTTNAEASLTASLTSFNSNGFTIGSATEVNTNGIQYVAYTFKAAPKFFDIVTYTGNGTLRTIPHNLQTTPGWIFIKARGSTQPWATYNGSNNRYMVLNTTAASVASTLYWNDTSPTSSVFTVNTALPVNGAGVEYVAYLFADGGAGGFGDSGSESIIDVGSYFGDGLTIGPIITDPGFEPQFVMIKNNGGTGNWVMVDNVRGMPYFSNGSAILANAIGAEITIRYVAPRGNGFQISNTATDVNQSGSTILYMAIRRGPMKAPTDATKVFQPTVYTGTNVDNRLVQTNILTDMVWARQRNDTVLAGMVVGDRSRGTPYMLTGSTALEVSDADSFQTPTSSYGNSFASMIGFGVGNDITSKLNVSTVTNNQIAEAFRRAPTFFDITTYTGNGSSQSVPHNLGQTPSLVIIKRRNTATAAWRVSTSAGIGYQLVLNTTAAYADPGANAISYGAGVIDVGNGDDVNAAGSYYVAYLFGNCPGVSKVGNYYGSGTTKQIDCGFTSGARFVLIKRTDTTGSWYIWDSARGIIAGNDPYLILNSTAAEVTNTDYVDTYSAGFELSSTAPAGLNEAPGITWNSISTAAGFGTSVIYSVAYCNDIYIACGGSGKIATTLYPNRTEVWQQRTSGFGTTATQDASYGNGTYVVVGVSGKISSSTNLSTWTSRTSGTTETLTGVTYGNGRFVAVGTNNTILTSLDGITWTSQTGSFGTDNILNVIYANSIFVAVGANGKLATSSDGITWASQTSGFGADSIIGIAYGNGTFVICGTNGKISTSTNATSWTSQTSGFGTASVNGVAYGAGIFTAVANGGALRTSPDGVTWTARTSGFSTTNILSVASDGTTFVAVGEAGTATTTAPNYIYLAIA